MIAGKSKQIFLEGKFYVTPDFIFFRTISLFTSQRRKPVFKQSLAHGLHETFSETEGVIQTPRWITALSTLRYSDVFASGLSCSLARYVFMNSFFFDEKKRFLGR